MPPAPKLPACSVGMGRAPPGQTQLGLGLLVPDLEEGVPGACGYSHAIISDPEAAHTVVVASEDTCTVTLHGIPDVAVEVVIASEQQPATAREGNRGDAADDVVVGIHEELLVSPQVKEAARGIIGARGEGIAVGEESHSIDVRFVANEGLSAHRIPYIPQLDRGITGT